MNMNCSNNIQFIPSSWNTGKIQYGYLEEHCIRPHGMYEAILDQ